MPYKAIIFTKKRHVAHVTLNRPDADNAVNQQLAQELEEVCTRISQDDDIYVVTVTGAGDAFCSGSEGELENAPCRPAAAIARIDRPVIAAINGDALGQGLELALAGDLRIAAETAHLGLPYITSGLIPHDGGTQRLPRLVGRAKAMEMVLLGEPLSARESYRIGLVNKMVQSEELLPVVNDMAQRIAASAPLALRYAKEAISKGLELTLEQGLRLETDLYTLLQTTEDRAEGITSFLEKRHPKFKGK